MRKLLQRVVSVLLMCIALDYACNIQVFAGTSGENTNVRLNATFNEAHITSGPIFLLDERTIFVSLFKYAHNGLNNIRKQSKWFKLQTKDNKFIDLYTLAHYSLEPDTQLAELARDYDKENIYLHLKKVEAKENPTQLLSGLSNLVIVNGNEDILAQVSLATNHHNDLRVSIGNPIVQNDYNVFRYPKCCPMGMYQSFDGCEPIDNDDIIRLPVYAIFNNEFYDKPLQNISYEPFEYDPQCDNMYHLDADDESYMLLNGRLLFSQDTFACIDYILEDEGHYSEVIFMCTPNDLLANMTQFLNTIYVTLMYISACALLLWALLILIAIAMKRVRVKTIKILTIIYSVLNAAQFATLATARILGVEKDLCKNMGYIYQFFLLSTFIALFALIYECYYRIKHYSRSHSPKRLYYYLCICAIPVLTTAISIGTNELTLPETGLVQRDNTCWFRSDRKVYYYYVPIFCVIISCMMIQISTYFNIRQANRDDYGLWPLQKQKYINMFHLMLYLNIINTACWLMEMLAYVFEVPNNFWNFVDGINSLQGVTLFGAFAYHFSDIWRLLFLNKPPVKKPPRNSDGSEMVERGSLVVVVPS